MNPYSDIDFWYQSHIEDCGADCGFGYCQLLSCMDSGNDWWSEVWLRHFGDPNPPVSTSPD